MGIGLLVDLLSPPLPPPVGTWGRACPPPMRAMEPWAVHFSIFFRFDFGLDFGLVLGPFWARLGRLLDPFWEPKSGQVGPKIHLEAVFVQKS